MIKEQVIEAFKSEFSFIQDRFEIMDLLGNESPMDYELINGLKLPSHEYNIVWYPGVYVFIGNGAVYRVGVSITNSRKRVMEHFEDCTAVNGHCIWDINNYPDKSILLFNVKDITNIHWLLALELFLECKFKPLIPSLRKG